MAGAIIGWIIIVLLAAGVVVLTVLCWRHFDTEAWAAGLPTYKRRELKGMCLIPILGPLVAAIDLDCWRHGMSFYAWFGALLVVQVFIGIGTIVWIVLYAMRRKEGARALNSQT